MTSDQEFIASTSHLSAGYDIESYAIPQAQYPNNPWIASNAPTFNDLIQSHPSAMVFNATNSDWNEYSDGFSNPYDGTTIQNNHLNNQYGNSFIPSTVDTTYNTGSNGQLKFHSIQNDALFAPNPFNSASNNELENNQHTHNIQTDAIPISKHVEITKNVPYPIIKQVHVPGN